MSRTRTFGPTITDKTDGYTLTSKYGVGGDTLSTDTVPFSTQYHGGYSYATMLDTSTIGFDGLRKRGVIICNPMLQVRSVGIGSPCSLALSAKWQRPASPFPWISVAYVGHVSPLTLGLGQADAPYGEVDAPTVDAPSNEELVAQAYSRLSRTPVNAWVSVGEMRENIETIRTTFHLVVRILSVRSKDFLKVEDFKLRNLKKELDRSAKLWLHLRYGIRPMIGEVNGALKALERLGSKTRSGFRSDIASDTATSSNSSEGYANLGNKFYLRRKVTRKITRSAYAGVLAQPVFEDANLLDLIGVGNALQGAWDLYPYSFVFQWFIDVAGWLATWSPNIFVTPLCDWVVVTTREEKVMEITPDGHVVAPSDGEFELIESNLVTQGGFASLTVTTKERITPAPKAYFPPLQLKVDAAKVLDLLALGRQFYLMKSGNW